MSEQCLCFDYNSFHENKRGIASTARMQNIAITHHNCMVSLCRIRIQIRLFCFPFLPWQLLPDHTFISQLMESVRGDLGPRESTSSSLSCSSAWHPLWYYLQNNILGLHWVGSGQCVWMAGISRGLPLASCPSKHTLWVLPQIDGGDNSEFKRCLPWPGRGYYSKRSCLNLEKRSDWDLCQFWTSS